METQTRNLIIAGALLLALLIGGYYVYIARTDRGIAAEGGTVATTTVNGTSTAQGEGSYTIQEVSLPAGLTAPDYTKPIKIDSSISSELAASIRFQYGAAQAAIKADPNDFDAWVMLGVMQKQAGDYRGAEVTWKYVSALYPTNAVTYANLADLYTFFLHDNAKAAAAYEQAIKNDPKQIRLYDDFYQLYTSYPASGASLKAAIEAGIKANPDSARLKQLLAQL